MEAIIDQFWTWRLSDAPEYASMVDVHKYDDRFEHLTPKCYADKVETCKKYLAQLDSIDTTKLDKDQTITYKLLSASLRSQVEGFKWRYHSAYNVVNFLENIPVDYVSFLIDSMKFETVHDFEIYIKRLEKIPDLVAEHISLMRLSVEEKTTLHEVSLTGAVQELVKNSTCAPEETVFFKPVKDDKKDLTEPIKDKVIEVIKTAVQPALAKQAEYLQKEYLPHTRQTYGVSSLPEGFEFYKACLQWHTSINIEPQEVFDLGLKEVARIREGMDKVRKEVEFEGDLKQFMEHLRTDKQFYHETQEQLLDEYKTIIQSHIDPKLPSMFEDIPDTQLKVEAMPFHGPGGMYFAPSEDGSRPGIFYVNLHLPETRPRFSMIALSLHEASPGHHFQHSLAIKEKLPNFRKELDYRKLYAAPFHFPIYTAYVEGWALYCEGLGIELGAYRNQYDLFGRYSDEILRACRLVVDPGLHVLGWSRKKAVDYMKDNTCLPLDEIEEEVDRYITWPGQACAYKIGELKILQLRKNAEQKLDAKFSLKEFHKVLLKVGPVPLQQLEEVVEDWIHQQI